MDNKFVLDNDTILNILDDIRKPNGDKTNNIKRFEDIVPHVWEKLGLKGIPNPTALENLLINVILKIYDVTKTEDIKQKLGIAQKRDFSLLSFGLLEGYYHTEEKNGKKVNIPSEKRYERYLNDGYFIEFKYSDEGSYQDIKIKDKTRDIISKSAQPRPLNALTSIAGKCKKEIGAELVILIESENYEQYMGKIQGTDDAYIPIILPKPYYTLKNFPKKVSEAESNLTNSSNKEESEQKTTITNNISICEEDERDTSTKDSGIQVSTNADSSKNNLQETFFIGLFPDESPESSVLPNILSVIKKYLPKIIIENKTLRRKIALGFLIFYAIIMTALFIRSQLPDQSNKTQSKLESELIDRGLFNESYTIEKICTSIYIYYTDEETGQKRRTSIIDEEISEEMIDAEVD